MSNGLKQLDGSVQINISLGITLDQIYEAMARDIALIFHASTIRFQHNGQEEMARFITKALDGMTRDSVEELVRDGIRRSHLNESTAKELFENYSAIDWDTVNVEQYIMPQIIKLFPEFEVKSDAIA